ncbi:flagellar basal body-associated FliL family protein [Roseitranquillus sediminis]|uniref:flagellar basal body-associated FliL family protein n=1 Tax=Roseitranquillus sediminis TaxID=2809051 RepID=UPI001D0C92EB|nr:flagellar basal body-associated FliL family protein [Roseitranquillus sediminis]MBM9596136.1 flagellar basal body-associated FliL family protein [Roseitranquillus sediminis]
MAATEMDAAEAPPKGSKKPLMLGAVLALALGGGGFYAVQSGMILGHAEAEAEAKPAVSALPDVTFVPLDPLVISLGRGANNRHLRFQAQLEVESGHQEEVAKMLPRVTDVLNGYLRAVSVDELEDPASLVRLRAQMLRRIQIVTGEGRARDLLIMEFVLN